MKRVVLSPSSLGHVRRDCERCFVREVAHGIRRPGGVPEAFNLADRAMHARFDASPAVVHDLGGAPAFRVLAQGLHVESRPFGFRERGVELVLKGRLDALIATAADDATLVLDYKTTRAVPHPRTYSAQLGAYALALEEPAAGEPRAIDGLAVLAYRPERFVADGAACGLVGPTTWLEVPRDDGKFAALLERVAALVVGDLQPTPNPRCAWCAFYGVVPPAHPTESAA